MNSNRIIVLVLGILLVIASAYVASQFVNRYRVVDGGMRRIDTITGKVWEKRTKEVFDLEKARKVISRLRKDEPRFEDVSEEEIMNFIRHMYDKSSYRERHRYDCMRNESYWHPVYDSMEEAGNQEDVIFPLNKPVVSE